MYFWIALLAAALSAAAQETPDPGQATHDMSNMPGMNHASMPGMKNDEAAMDASGTSRNPASAPMNMVHFQAGRWTLMVHGTAFVTDIQETGPRGADKFMSVNWAMGVAEHALGGGTISFRSMLSLEPLTITERRYPELFQTGETAYGKPIIDGQHPHNFVMELGVAYTHSLGAGTSLELYAAPVGDPALGPVAYPHRSSAEEIPQAPITHHLIDSTHVSYDVVTAGLSRGIFRLEASGFHGAEPGENRWNIGYGAIDSYSARLSVTPSANWTGEFSAGRLTKPEALEPGDQTRLEASVTYNKQYTGGNWATSAIWGRVHKTDTQANLNGYLLEAVARFRNRNLVTGRIERADKDELFGNMQAYRVGSYMGGYTRDFNLVRGIATGVGANFTVYSMPAGLNPFYGRRPVMALVFVRFRVKEAAEKASNPKKGAS